VTRWDGLFADLEAQAVAIEAAERAGEVEERIRIESGALRLVDRLRTAVGGRIRVRCQAGTSVDGTVRRSGSDWLLLDEGTGREALVSLRTVVELAGLGRSAAVPGSETVVESRLTFRIALRGLVRDRSTVQVRLTDGRTVTGTLDRVGADFVELAEHPAGELRRAAEVRDLLLLPIQAIVLVRRQL
jgi:hypothetical protein